MIIYCKYIIQKSCTSHLADYGKKGVFFCLSVVYYNATWFRSLKKEVEIIIISHIFIIIIIISHIFIIIIISHIFIIIIISHVF